MREPFESEPIATRDLTVARVIGEVSDAIRVHGFSSQALFSVSTTKDVATISIEEPDVTPVEEVIFDEFKEN